MRCLYFAWLTALGALALAFILAAWLADAECRAAGGVRLRPLFGTWQCYEVGSLKVVKEPER